MSDYYSTVFTETVSISEWISLSVINPSQQELSAHDDRCWVNWRLENKGGKLSKVPYRPDGKMASTNPADWVHAEMGTTRHRFNGIIVFTGSMLGRS
jgi:hypothetical protein